MRYWHAHRINNMNNEGSYRTENCPLSMTKTHHYAANHKFKLPGTSTYIYGRKSKFLVRLRTSTFRSHFFAFSFAGLSLRRRHRKQASKHSHAAIFTRRALPISTQLSPEPARHRNLVLQHVVERRVRWYQTECYGRRSGETVVTLRTLPCLVLREAEPGGIGVSLRSKDDACPQ
jgi:hypothetical protein